MAKAKPTKRQLASQRNGKLGGRPPKYSEIKRIMAERGVSRQGAHWIVRNSKK